MLTQRYYAYIIMSYVDDKAKVMSTANIQLRNIIIY